MPRVQFALPERFVFATDIQIYISHVNQGGHLDNAQLLTLVSEARVRFFKSLGYTEGNVAGHPIVVGDMVAQYKSEGFHGETMRVSMVPQDYTTTNTALTWPTAWSAWTRRVKWRAARSASSSLIERHAK